MWSDKPERELTTETGYEYEANSRGCSNRERVDGLRLNVRSWPIPAYRTAAYLYSTTSHS